MLTNMLRDEYFLITSLFFNTLSNELILVSLVYRDSDLEVPKSRSDLLQLSQVGTQDSDISCIVVDSLP